MTAVSAVQYDLFGEVAAAENHRLVAALRCLREAMPEALEIVVELRAPARDTRAPRKCGPWAFCVSRAGLRVETTQEWSAGARARGEPWAWDRTPAHLATWAELTVLLGADPRRAEIAAWRDGLPAPRWPRTTRPHELHPRPHHWHRSHLCHDHLDAHWPGRRRAWQLVLDLLDDAITSLNREGTTP